MAQGTPEQVLTGDTLREVYGIEAEILKDKFGLAVRRTIKDRVKILRIYFKMA